MLVKLAFVIAFVIPKIEKISEKIFVMTDKDGGGGREIFWFYVSYQAFYGLKHYNLLETWSFLIRKLNQPTSCLMLQFKGKIHLNYHLIAGSSKKIMFLVH